VTDQRIQVEKTDGGMDLCPPDLCPKKKQKEMISALVLNDQLMSIEYIVEIHANP
jgi:hypothetical protein